MNTYFERYAYPVKLFDDSPTNNLKLSVVIPCYNEPDIISTLESLKNCQPVDGVEVLIIVNESETCEDEVKKQNRTTLEEIETWKNHHKLNFTLLAYHLIVRNKDAGVGLARKVGMDEAARRFEQIKNRKGVICCFDADSTCAPNYLISVSNHFYAGKLNHHGASVYFEHMIPDDARQKEGIIQYELHLRYYVQALRLIGYPYAHQTVGSSMIVRSDIYQKIGGMNKRKAGEDFYFLHRLMPAGKFIDINNTVIYPSPRISDRVPFGTGKAMGKWQEEKPKDYLTYNLQSFLELKTLFGQAEKFYNVSDSQFEAILGKLPESINSFLISDRFKLAVGRLNKHSNNSTTFLSKWYQYFDGFKVLKYLHFSRDNYYKNIPVAEGAKALATLRWQKDNVNGLTAENLLAYFRQKDRSY